MNQVSYMTQEGYDKIKHELDQLKSTGRQEVAKAIAEAREKGDLSENAEYHAAKDAQGMLEMKINDLELKLANVRIIDQSNIDTSKVTMLTFVRMKNHKLKKELTYQIVAEAEADLKQGKISVNSLIGQGLFGKSVGEKTIIQISAGEMVLEILEIHA